MDISKEHEDFCKVFKPKYGTIFNIDTVQFESLDDCFYDDAKMLNWAFGGWLAAKQQAIPEGFVVANTDSLKKAIGFMCTAQCHPNNTNGYEQEIEELISSFEIMIQEAQK